MKPKVDVNKIKHLIDEFDKIIQNLPDKEKPTLLETVAFGMTIVHDALHQMVSACTRDRGHPLECKDLLYDMLITILVDLIFRIYGELDERIMLVLKQAIEGNRCNVEVI